MVRKEKMGDRVTALQQLVSPFGKTDTASVLSDAIEYIKFLHEQISVFPLGILRVSSSVFYNTVPHSSACCRCTTCSVTTLFAFEKMMALYGMP
ncbi:hypothetical protein ABFS83_04G160800 [Erythranthe nasuta]